MTTFKDLQHGTVNPFQPNTKAISYAIDKTLEQGVHKIDLITNGTYTLGLWLDDTYIGMFCGNSLTFELANDVYVEDVIIKEYNDLGEIEYVKLVSGSNVTEWTPAPEDFNNLKGKSYALSQPLRKENTLSLNGSFEEDDFIGLWLGDDKFVGFLDNQELAFNLAENYDDQFVVVKTLSEKGIINNAKLEKGNVAHRWTPAPEDKSIPKIRFFEYVKIISKPHEIDDSMLIKKQTIHLDDPSQNTIEVGVEVSSFTDKQLEANNAIKKINADYVTNEKMTNVITPITVQVSQIIQQADSIELSVSELRTDLENEIERVETETTAKIVANTEEILLEKTYTEERFGVVHNEISEANATIRILNNAINQEVVDRETQGEQIMNETRSTVEQLSTSFELIFEKLENGQDLLDNELQLFQTYFRWDANGAVIGKSGSPVEFFQTNDMIGFRENGTVIAHWEKGTQTVDNLIAKMSIVIGTHLVEKYESPVAGTTTLIRRVNI